MTVIEREHEKCRIVGAALEWLGWRAGRACSEPPGYACDAFTDRWLDRWRGAAQWCEPRDVARLYLAMELDRQRGIADGSLCRQSFQQWEIDRAAQATPQSVWRDVARQARTPGEYWTDHAVPRAVYRLVTYWSDN